MTATASGSEKYPFIAEGRSGELNTVESHSSHSWEEHLWSSHHLTPSHESLGLTIESAGVDVSNRSTPRPCKRWLSERGHLPIFPLSYHFRFHSTKTCKFACVFHICKCRLHTYVCSQETHTGRKLLKIWAVWKYVGTASLQTGATENRSELKLEHVDLKSASHLVATEIAPCSISSESWIQLRSARALTTREGTRGRQLDSS